jgi:hypothetical protein
MMSRSLNHNGPGLLRVLVSTGLLLSMAAFGQVGSAQRPSAQTARPKAAPANRWLFVAETSSAMQPRAEAVQQIVGSLLASGMEGQMRPGDTVGLWTFNEVSYTGRFPLQRWTPESAKSLAKQAYDFLKNQTYEKASRFDFVMSDLEQVIQDSEFITVILITAGHEKMRGTPFDDKINTLYQTWRKQQDKARMPFLTVLRAQRGQIRSFSVTMPPWPLDLPPLPAELLPAKTAEAKTAPPPAPTPPPVVQPLIVRGTNVGAAADARPSEPDISNAPPAMAPAAKAASTAAPATNPVPVPTAQPAAPAVSSDRTAEAESPLPAPPSPAPTGTVALAETGAPAATVTTPPAASQQVDAPTRPAMTGTPVQAAVAVPPEPGASRNHLWILALGITALVLAGVALAIVYLLARRLRAPIRINLKTDSSDREKK